MGYRTCESCGEGFHQYGRGRPAKRCPGCRGGDRYGPRHQAARAATIDQAIGQMCARCKLPILEGQPVDLDHADNGQGYLGYSHRRCNASAGAARGNSLRAAAYRMVKAGMVPATNGMPPPARDPRLDNPECVRTRELINAGNAPLACLCGKITSRCW